MSPLDVTPAMAALAGIGMAIDSAETLFTHDALAPTGLYSWNVLSLGRQYLVAGPLARPLGRLFQYPTVLILPLVQLLAAAVLIVGPLLPSYRGPVVAAVALLAATARILFYMRQQLGLDGADQMLVILLISAGFGSAFGNTSVGSAAVDYAAFQLLLSYLIAGIAKALSKQWRSGQAICGITGTIGYGQQWVHSLLERWPVLARITCWSVILFECGAPVVALSSVRGTWLVIIVGTCFHLGIAILMGLNVFVWAFTGCYPALLLLAAQVHNLG
jgi:hypothetical protein